MNAEPDRTRRPLALDEAAAVLSRTPATVDALLRGLSDGWLAANEGPETWSPFDVVGHLIHADRANWLPRIQTILEHGETRAFDDFDRFAQLSASKGLTIADLLDEFAGVRQESLQRLAPLRPSDFDRQGRHPALGVVTLGQLLAAWVAHDLDHLMQIVRVMARQYSDEVGPWRRYLRIVREG